MAQYFEDFGDETVGSQPSGWTARYDTDSPSWTVESEASAEKGGVVVEMVRTDSDDGNAILTWDEIDTDANRDNVEVVIRSRYSSNDFPNANVSAACGRASGSEGSEDFYFGGFRVEQTNDDQLWTVGKYTGGSRTQLEKNGDRDWTANQWHYHRLRINGTDIKLRTWTGTVGDEPSAWTYEQVDSDHSGTGWVGFYSFLREHTAQWDWIGVGTGGDTAPASATGGAITGTGSIESVTTQEPAGTVNLIDVSGFETFPLSFPITFSAAIDASSTVESVGTQEPAGTASAPSTASATVESASVDEPNGTATLGVPPITATASIESIGATEPQATVSAPATGQATTESVTTAEPAGSVSAPTAGLASPETLSVEGPLGSASLGGADVIDVVELAGEFVTTAELNGEFAVTKDLSGEFVTTRSLEGNVNDT